MGIITGYLSQLVGNGIKLLNGGSAVSSSNPLPVLTKSETVLTNTGTIGALNATIVLAVTNGYKTASAIFTDGNISGSFEIQASFDSGATYRPLTGKRLDAVADTPAGWSFSGSNFIGKAYQCAIPAGATHVQLICTSYTSGTSTGKLIVSSDTASTINPVILQSGTYRIGFVAASGIQYTDTTAALGSSATFTSSARDLVGTTQANAFNSIATYAKTASICVVQDVAFTLQLLGSTDNFGSVSEIYRSITATLVGSNYVAEVDSHSVAWRYFQYKIVNGAGAAARTRGVSKFLAN